MLRGWDLPESIINQDRRAAPGGRHGGVRSGAGRPHGSRDRVAKAAEADIAALVQRIAIADLLALGPTDVLRLAMLVAFRRGALEMAADHARRLAVTWVPAMALPWSPERPGGSRGAYLVERLIRDLELASPPEDRRR